MEDSSAAELEEAELGGLATVLINTTICPQVSCEILNVKARELIAYSIDNDLPNAFFSIENAKFCDFIQAIIDHLFDLYATQSLSPLNFPYEAAHLVVLLSITGTLQKDLREQIYSLEDRFNFESTDRSIIRINHYHAHIGALLRRAIEYCYGSFKPPEYDPMRFAISNSSPKFECIPSLVFQIRFYDLINVYDSNGKCTKEWFDKFYEFYMQYKTNYFDNQEYKPNRYEIYLTKYFQSKFDVAFYLFTLMECVIDETFHILKNKYYLKNTKDLFVLSKGIESTIGTNHDYKRIDIETIPESCFSHCLSKRFYLMKGYDPIAKFKAINPVYARFVKNVVNTDFKILYNRNNTANTAMKSVARSRIRVTIKYQIQLLLNCLKTETNQEKMHQCHRELFTWYFQFAEMSLLCMPLQPLLKSTSVYNTVCNYVQRFILPAAVKSEAHYKLWPYQSYPPKPHYINNAQQISIVYQILIWCYFLIGNEEKCQQYCQIYRLHYNHHFVRALPNIHSVRLLSIIDIIRGTDDEPMWQLYNFLRKKQRITSKGKHSGNYSYSYDKNRNWHENQRLKIYSHFISSEQERTQQTRQNIVVHAKYNFVKHVFQADITDSKYIGWRNLALQKQCQLCYQKIVTLKKCKGCRKVCYCSKLCQKRHWISEHRLQCQSQ